MNLNKVFIIGNLTREPEMRTLPSGQPVCTFSIATNRTWKDRGGARQTMAEYHNIVMFGKLAELAAQYLKKGSGVYVEGRMQTRSWDDPSGKKYRTEVIADSMQFGPRAGAPGATGSYSPAAAAPASKAAPAHEALETIEYPEEDINPDDIPF